MMSIVGRKSGDPVRARARQCVCNLVLVSRSKVNRRSDLETIRRLIRDQYPDVHPLVVEDGRRYLPHNLYLWMRPTMPFSTVQVNHFRLLRGQVYQGQPLSKSQECTALEKAGLPVPRWALVTPEHTPDLAELGPYVVMKPDRGSQGADVKIVRKSRVRFIEPKTYKARDTKAWPAQEFIYTGPWPVSYRVLSLFGQALYATRTEADHRHVPLPDRYAFDGASQPGGMTIVSTGKGCTYTLCHDPEIIRMGEAAHRAFPDIPLLGVDILREVPGGALYISEVNASGKVWHFSSPAGLNIQQEFGFNFESQFDGFRKAARVLAEQARAGAR